MGLKTIWSSQKAHLGLQMQKISTLSITLLNELQKHFQPKIFSQGNDEMFYSLWFVQKTAAINDNG